MKDKKQNGRLALILGGLTLILFSIKPYLLDLIEPAKSIGTIIGENAKDLIESIKGESQESPTSKRQIWSNVLTIIAFISLAFSLILAYISLQNGANKLTVTCAVCLSLIGLVVYFLHLSISLISFIFIAILVVIVVIFVDVI